MKEHIWLVEIVLKSWVPDIPGVGRVVTYVEVVASSEAFARNVAINTLENRLKYEPVMKRKFEKWGVTINDCGVSDAVCLEEI